MKKIIHFLFILIFVLFIPKGVFAYTPNDPYYPSQWYLSKVNFPRSWDITKGSRSIVVAVLDTGVNYFHEDLKNKMWQDENGYFGYDFVNDDPDPMDDHKHGTLVAGIIAAQIDNLKGISGAAPNVKIMAVKVIQSNGEGKVSDIVKGIRYAVDHGASVINMSFGLEADSLQLSEAIDYAYKKGVVLIAATGNKGNDFIDYPAAYPNVLAVGAVDEIGLYPLFSNTGPQIDVVAPGVDILSTSWSSFNQINLYENGRGTSFAAPLVSAQAALLLSKEPLSPDQVYKRIIITCKKLPAMAGAQFNYKYGWGEIDVLKSLTYDKNPPFISIEKIQEKENGIVVEGLIRDDFGPDFIYPNVMISSIKSGRYKVDQGPWYNFISQPKFKPYQFKINLGKLPKGEHELTIEVYDSSGNFKTETRVFKVEAAEISLNPLDYHAKWISQSPYPTLAPGEVTELWVEFKNVGRSAWSSEFVHLGTSNPIDRFSNFALLKEGWIGLNRVKMDQSIVSPGEIARFTFKIKAPSDIKPGIYREYFRPVADGIVWMEDYGLYWDIKIVPASYHAKWVAQSPNPILKPGEITRLWVEFKNTGTTTWTPEIVKLGTANPLDRISYFRCASWLSPNRIRLDQEKVAPGEIGRFTFTICAPKNVYGTFREYFRPVADGITWMEDYGLYWDITVK